MRLLTASGTNATWQALRVSEWVFPGTPLTLCVSLFPVTKNTIPQAGYVIRKKEVYFDLWFWSKVEGLYMVMIVLLAGFRGGTGHQVARDRESVCAFVCVYMCVWCAGLSAFRKPPVFNYGGGHYSHEFTNPNLLPKVPPLHSIARWNFHLLTTSPCGWNSHMSF